MGYGLWSGVLWALDTILLGIGLAQTPFIDSHQALFLAPFVSTFLHDFTAAILLWIRQLRRKNCKNVINVCKKDVGRYIMLGGILAGPIGMSAYISAIKYMGPSNTAIVSSMYPAFGALFAWFFLGEKMKLHQVLGLIASICGVMLLTSCSITCEVANFPFGMVCGVIACIGWASEAVVIAYGLKNKAVDDEMALTIRETTSALCYGVILLPVLGGYELCKDAIANPVYYLIIVAAVSGLASYLFYYKSINKIGAIRSMALNITYAAWAIVLSLLIFKSVPTVKEVICGLVVIVGSIFAASSINPIKEFKKK